MRKKIIFWVLLLIISAVVCNIFLKNSSTMNDTVVDLKEDNLLPGAEKFIGIIKRIYNGCERDLDCGVSVGDRWIVTLGGRGYCSYPQEMGSFSFADWDSLIGKRVEVYARKESDKNYTLCGSSDFYIKFAE